MNFPLLILLATLGFFGWRAWRRMAVYDRSLATRGGLALLVVNLLLIIGLVFLPGKSKLLAVIPAFLTMGSTIQAVRSARQRFRERVETNSRFERAKRVN